MQPSRPFRPFRRTKLSESEYLEIPSRMERLEAGIADLKSTLYALLGANETLKKEDGDDCSTFIGIQVEIDRIMGEVRIIEEALANTEFDQRSGRKNKSAVSDEA